MQASEFKIAVLPIPAREVNSTVPVGNNFAELFFSPNSVILLLLSFTNISFPISTGENQLISPFQYSAIFIPRVAGSVYPIEPHNKFIIFI